MSFKPILHDKKPACIGLLVAFVGTACAAPQPPSPQPPTPGPAPSAQPATAAPPAPAPPPSALPAPIHWSQDWTPLFDGKTLANWQVTDFGGQGPVTVQSNQIRLGMGDILTGISWTNGPLPTNDYEISLQAVKLDGSDFFCGLTFPVGKSWCSLILGGWGGGVVGLSSLDGSDASENETTKMLYFEPNHWFLVRLQVRTGKIRAWLDDKKIIDVSTAGRVISLRPGPIYLSKPLGVAAYQTSSAIRDFKLRLLKD